MFPGFRVQGLSPASGVESWEFRALGVRLLALVGALPTSESMAILEGVGAL